MVLNCVRVVSPDLCDQNCDRHNFSKANTKQHSRILLLKCVVADEVSIKFYQINHWLAWLKNKWVPICHTYRIWLIVIWTETAAHVYTDSTLNIIDADFRTSQGPLSTILHKFPQQNDQSGSKSAFRDHVIVAAANAPGNVLSNANKLFGRSTIEFHILLFDNCRQSWKKLHFNGESKDNSTQIKLFDVVLHAHNSESKPLVG